MDEEFETFLLIMLWPFVLKVMCNYYFLRISGQWMESFQIKSLKYEDLIITVKMHCAWVFLIKGKWKPMKHVKI